MTPFTVHVEIKITELEGESAAARPLRKEEWVLMLCGSRAAVSEAEEALETDGADVAQRCECS